MKWSGPLGEAVDVEFFFIDTNPLVESYWKENNKDYKWLLPISREEYIANELKVNCWNASVCTCNEYPYLKSAIIVGQVLREWLPLYISLCCRRTCQFLWKHPRQSGRLPLVTIQCGVSANMVKLLSSLIKCSLFLRCVIQVFFFGTVDRIFSVLHLSFFVDLPLRRLPIEMTVLYGILFGLNFRRMEWTCTSMVMITVCNTSSALTGIISVSPASLVLSQMDQRLAKWKEAIWIHAQFASYYKISSVLIWYVTMGLFFSYCLHPCFRVLAWTSGTCVSHVHHASMWNPKSGIKLLQWK